MSDKPKKKVGSIAIPFLVTIFIATLIVGGAVYFIYHNFVSKKEDKIKEPPPRNGSISVSVEDSHTVLLVLDDPEAAADANATFVLMRSVPYKKNILFIGVPSNSIYYSEKEGTQIALKDKYTRGGAQAAEEFIEEALKIDIDKYMVFDVHAFETVCDLFGGVNYPVDIKLNGYAGDGTLETLAADEITKYLTYNKFPGGEPERALKAATIISYMINGSDGDRIANNFDRYFSEIINMIPNTNVTAVDYDKKKSAIKYMFNFGSGISIAACVDGTDAEKDFIPSDSFISNLPEEYFGEPTEPPTRPQ